MSQEGKAPRTFDDAIREIAVSRNLDEERLEEEVREQTYAQAARAILEKIDAGAVERPDFRAPREYGVVL